MGISRAYAAIHACVGPNTKGVPCGRPWGVFFPPPEMVADVGTPSAASRRGRRADRSGGECRRMCWRVAGVESAIEDGQSCGAREDERRYDRGRCWPGLRGVNRRCPRSRPDAPSCGVVRRAANAFAGVRPACSRGAAPRRMRPSGTRCSTTSEWHAEPRRSDRRRRWSTRATRARTARAVRHRDDRVKLCTTSETASRRSACPAMSPASWSVGYSVAR